jgi:hypothetical protein
MELITRKTKAKEAAESWAKVPSRRNYTDVYQKLTALGDNPNPDDVDMIIGNSSWTTTSCHECESENVDVVQLGYELDYDSPTARICKKCLINALALMDN